MDPLSALGLASAILQIIDSSSKLISGAAEVYSSTSGTTVRLEDSDRAIQSLKNLTRRLDVRTTGGPLSIEDRSLLEMKRGCEDLSRDIQAVINSTRAKNTGSKRASVVASWKTMRNKGKLKTLEGRLDGYRAQAQEYLLSTLSDDLSNTNRYLEVLTQEQVQYSQTTRSEIRQMKKDITTVIHEAQVRQAHRSGGVSCDPLLLLPAIQESLDKLVKATQVVAQEDDVLQRLWFPELGGREHTVEMPHGQTFRWLLYDSEPQDPDKQDLEGEIQWSTGVIKDSMSSDQDFCSEQNTASNDDDDDDGVSFHTAPDGNERGKPDALSKTGAHAESWLSEHRRMVLQKEKEWRNQKRESFLNWLRTEDGIFYCSGKAGSGKSTLMKFLTLENQTKNELSLWSQTQGKTLILASFFFWSSGTLLQRSLEGLYREILWEILRNFPSLIPVVLPAAWSSGGDGSPSVAHRPFTMDELECAVERLFCEEAVTSSHRICLFIDGLDEFDGDYWKLSRAISHWAASSKDIKFCLSSRPHRVFLQHFGLGDARHLKLHELTRHDMYQFVSDQFRQDDRYTAVEEDISREINLFEAIMNRSDGVFLWVRLVTAELLTGMGEDCSTRQLIKKLDSIPLGLGNMFRQMLNSIDASEQQRAAEMFLTMTVPDHHSHQGTPTWIVFMQAILDDLTDDPRLADSLLSGNVGPYLCPSECIRKCHIAGSRAITRCKGLVEVTHTGQNFPECHKLSFVHRTVGDFFKDADIQSRLKITVGDFCPHRRLCHSVLGCFKIINPNEWFKCHAYEPHRRRGSAAVKLTVTRISDEEKNQGLTVALLSTIRNAELDGISHLAAEVEAMISMMRQTATQSQNDEFTYGLKRPQFFLDPHLCLRSIQVPIATEYLHSAVVSYSMAWIEVTETAFELASRHPEILVPSPGNHHVFLSAALSDLLGAFDSGEDVRRTRLLIEQASPSINADWSKGCVLTKFDDPLNACGRTLGTWVNTWSAFLLALSQLLGTDKPRTESNLAGISTQLELFLQHGADPSVVFIGYSFATPTDDMASPQPRGPLHMDLLDMIMFWRLVPTYETLNILNAARHQQRRGWLHRSFDGLPWVGRQTQDAYSKMSPLHDNIGGRFLPLSISPYGSLADVSLEALHETADWISKQGSSNIELVIDI